jgi:hypothetical protein
MTKMFSELCTPARIYFIIAVVGSIVGLFYGLSIGSMFMNLIFVFIWTYILGWLCKKGYSSVSWFLVLLPYILILLAMLNITSEGFVEGARGGGGGRGRGGGKGSSGCKGKKCKK